MRATTRIFLLLPFLALQVSCSRLSMPSLAPIDQSTQAPLVSGVRSGAIVELWTGQPGGRRLIAASSPVPAGVTRVRVQLPNRLSPGEVIRARQRVWFRKSAFSDPVTVENNYVTHRYDNERSGWNPHEATLTVRRVKRGFGKICEHLVDGLIRAQPLYVQDVEIPGKGKHNIVLVETDATESSPANPVVKGDQVWAFDAESCAALWEDASGKTGPRELLGAGETIPVIVTCPPISQNHGIFATPAIDRTTNTMYVVAAVQKGGDVFYRLHALDIATGRDTATPVVLNGTKVQFALQGNRTVNFDPSVQINRPGLLMDNGVLYVAFGSSCDRDSYHGWVVAYDANLPGSATFLTQLGVFNTSPNETSLGSGVWQGGLGLAADGDGTVYLMTGNGNFDPSKGSYGNTVLRLRLPTGATNKNMSVVSFFTPWDWNTLYNPGDVDLGSGGPVLFRSGSRRLLLAQGKPPKAYLLDRDCTNCNGDPNRCIPTTGAPCTADDPNLVIQTLTTTDGITHGVVAGPAYYVGPSGTRVFFGFNFNPMSAFDSQANPPHLVTPPEVTLLDPAPATSPIPTVSSHGTIPGSAILWAVFHPATASQPLTLHAYDAADLHDNLFQRPGVAQMSLDIGNWIPLGSHYGNSFQVPTVIHGKVYCGSVDRLVVVGPQRRMHCSYSVNCGGSVTFHCSKESESERFQLQRRQGPEWRTVTDSASLRNLREFAYAWDYPPGDSATYRVCSQDYPDGCTPAFTLKVSHRPCDVERGVPCGRRGSPPCFLDRPWPVQSGPEPKGDHSDRD